MTGSAVRSPRLGRRTLAFRAADGRPSLTPMWFDYHDDKVLINVAAHRKKTAWIRNSKVSTFGQP